MRNLILVLIAILSSSACEDDAKQMDFNRAPRSMAEANARSIGDSRYGSFSTRTWKANRTQTVTVNGMEHTVAARGRGGITYTPTGKPTWTEDLTPNSVVDLNGRVYLMGDHAIWGYSEKKDEIFLSYISRESTLVTVSPDGSAAVFQPHDKSHPHTVLYFDSRRRVWESTPDPKGMDWCARQTVVNVVVRSSGSIWVHKWECVLIFDTEKRIWRAQAITK